MSSKIRLIELDDKEVMVNVNDLLIELLCKIDQSSNDVEKLAYRAVVARLMQLRDRGHKQ